MRLLLPLLILLTFVACDDDDDQFTMPVVTVTPTQPADTTAPEINYLALGDSYTIGTGVTESERWPVQLAEALRAEKDIPVASIQTIAFNGWRTDNLQDGIRLSETQLLDEYGLVSLLIGVNDQFQGVSETLYEQRFTELLNRAVQLAGGDKDRVFVVSIPDYAFTPFGGGSESITEGIDRFNTINRRITDNNAIVYFNITPISREGLDKPELVAGDDLHPSGLQYQRWIEEILLDRVAELLTAG